MSSRTAEFASAILIGATVGVFAGAYLITMPYAASDDCLAQPTGNTPQGQHWFYRIEHGSKRHCWYLRGETEKSSRVASSDKSAKAVRKQDGGSQHSIADAHAELRARARIEDNTSAAGAQPGPSSLVANAAVNIPAVDDNGAGANVMSRWPDPVDVSPAAAAQPDTAPTTVVADAQTAGSPTLDQAAVPADPAPASSAPAPLAGATDQQDALPQAAANGTGKYSGSLQELLMVAFAALALAGLTGSGVYRLARAGRATRYDASRRSNDWQRPKKRKKSSKAARVEPQPLVMESQKVAESQKAAPKAKFAPEPQYGPEPDHVPESRYAAAQSDHDYGQQPQSDSDYAPEHGYEPEHSYQPQPEYAPRPQVAAQPSYATSAHSDYEPVSEYAPKPVSQYAPKPRGRVHSRELDESYESIEQLLIRLAK